MITLFPGDTIHIGGDEVDKANWKVCPKCQARMKAEALKTEEELQSWFIRRIEKFLNSKGKKLMGWDEILEGGLAPNAAVMSWRGTEGGIAAAREGQFVDGICRHAGACRIYDFPEDRRHCRSGLVVEGFEKLFGFRGPYERAV